jgi:hypothetical protein
MWRTAVRGKDRSVCIRLSVDKVTGGTCVPITSLRRASKTCSVLSVHSVTATFNFRFIEIFLQRFAVAIHCMTSFQFMFVHCALQPHRPTVPVVRSLGFNPLSRDVCLFFCFWKQGLRVSQKTGPRFHIYVAGSGYCCRSVDFFVC